MSDNGRMDSVMLEEFNIGQMDRSTKDTGEIVRENYLIFWFEM